MDYEKLAEYIEVCGSSPKINQCKECPYWNGGDMTKCIPMVTKEAASAIKELKEQIEDCKTAIEIYKNYIIPGYKRTIYKALKLIDDITKNMD